MPLRCALAPSELLPGSFGGTDACRCALPPGRADPLDARTPGNILIHSMVIDGVPGEGRRESYVKVALEHDDDRNRPPYVYLNTNGEGADPNVLGVDQLIAALQQARAAIVGSNVDPAPAVPAAATPRIPSAPTVNWQRTEPRRPSALRNHQ